MESYSVVVIYKCRLISPPYCRTFVQAMVTEVRAFRPESTMQADSSLHDMATICPSGFAERLLVMGEDVGVGLRQSSATVQAAIRRREDPHLPHFETEVRDAENSDPSRLRRLSQNLPVMKH